MEAGHGAKRGDDRPAGKPLGVVPHKNQKRQGEGERRDYAKPDANDDNDPIAHATYRCNTI